MSEQKEKVKKPFYKRWWVWVIAGFLVVGALGGGNDDKQTAQTSAPAAQSAPAEQPKAEPAEQTIKVTAPVLFADYEANEVAADEKYKGKLLEVSGTVDSIGKDILDDMYVAIKTDNIISSVQCMFEKEATGELSALKKGQSITIKGKCNGKMGNVILKDSVIVK